jgi:gamma-glutamyltranspeptidase/glutathione hydrolase
MMGKTRGMIAAGDRATAVAGQAILELGGNAFDAAIAAMLASFVVEPTLTSAGGGGFLLAHTQEGQNLLFDFFSQTPRQKKPSAEIDFRPVDVDFGDAIQTFHMGLGAIAVPGTIAGAFRIQKALGRLPLAVVAEPAIAYAENGFSLSSFQDFCINQLLHPILLALPEGRKIYAPNQQLLKAGDRVYMKDFANTLRQLVRYGDREFYQGEIAHQFIQDCQERGGHLSLEDLSEYRVIIRRPLQFNYRGYLGLTNPPPSSGGALIAFALSLLSEIDLAGFQPRSREHLDLLATVMRLTNVARQDGYDANLYEDNIAEFFLQSSHLSPYQEELRNKFGSTTHISVIDSDGNAASVTTSNGEGSSYVIPGTGIMLNNMLGEADLNPGGFHRWPCDRRLSSMMSPTLILNEQKPYIVLGSGGSNRIRTAILQVISNLIDFQLPIQEAIEMPRVHWEENVFNLEPPVSADLAESLQLTATENVILWQEKSMFFGGVHGVQKDRLGAFSGAGDSRRGGVVAESI